MTELLYLINGALVVGFLWLYAKDKSMLNMIRKDRERRDADRKAHDEWLKQHHKLHHDTASSIAGRFKDIHGRLSDEVKRLKGDNQ